MPNISFIVGSLDLSQYIRVNPGEGLNLGAGDMLEPAFSDSPLYEGQVLTSVHAKNKELIVPLYLHPATAPYGQSALNDVVVQVNQALRPVVDLGQTIYGQWTNAQANSSTFFTIQYGRFDPDFSFRITEKGWLAGQLHLWTLPYAHTATERIVGTWSAPAAQNALQIAGASLVNSGGSIDGDISPQFDLRVTTGSYLGDSGRVGIISALPNAGFNPIIAPSQFINAGPSGRTFPGSGAFASTIFVFDSAVSSFGTPAALPGAGGAFTAYVSPGSVYSGDLRVFGLARHRYQPFGLRAFDTSGAPLGPTAVASACDGWQLLDYGTLRIPPWVATAQVTVRAYGSLPPTASGIYAQSRAWPGWLQEHGPLFILPANNTIMELDFNTPPLFIDGFDGPSGGVIGAGNSPDQLGNQWLNTVATAVMQYDGNSNAVTTFGGNANACLVGGGSTVDLTQWGIVIETSVKFASAVAGNEISLGGLLPFGVFPVLEVNWNAGPSGNMIGGAGASAAMPCIPGQWYDLKAAFVNGNQYLSIGGPSGAVPAFASHSVACVGLSGQTLFASQVSPAIQIQVPTGVVCSIGAARARMVGSSGFAPKDIFHVYQPLGFNTRGQSPAAGSIVDNWDLQSRQRGPLGAISLTPPSMGAGLFAMSLGWDSGPANDVISVDVRVRERFIYAR